MGYLRQHQVEELENEKRVIENTLVSRDVQDRGNLNQHLKRIDHQVATQAPPDLTPEDRDRVVRECNEIEGRLVPNMPSDEEMRRNPPGVVGRHMRYEKIAKCKDYFPEGDLARWKDNQLALNKGSEDPDVANFERMRPIHNMGSMQGAQIPGTQYFGTNPSEAYKEGHDQTFGEPDLEDEPELETPARERRPAVRRKKATRKKKGARKQRAAAPVETLACGFAMGKVGRHFHIKKCKPCQEAGQE